MSEENANRGEKMSSGDDAAVRFGRAVKIRRVHLDLSRRDLAERAELSYPYVSEIEKGSKEPSAKSLRQLASALGFNSTAELMAWVEAEQPAPEAGDENLSAPPIRPTTVGTAGLATPDRSSRVVPPSPLRPPTTGLSDELSDAIELAVRRALDSVFDDLRRETVRIVEAEVARRLRASREPW